MSLRFAVSFLAALTTQFGRFSARILPSQLKQVNLPYHSQESVSNSISGEPPSNASCQAISDADRKDCGYSGITQQICEYNNSCCWVPINDNPVCFLVYTSTSHPHKTDTKQKNNKTTI